MMKKMYVLFLTLVALFTVFSSLAFVQARTADISPACVVVDPGVGTAFRTIRATPVHLTTGGVIVVTIPANTLVTQTLGGNTQTGNWINIRTSFAPNGGGWVLRSNLQVDPNFC